MDKKELKIFVKARPGAKEERVEQVDPTHYVIAVRERATENAANFAVLRALAEHLKIPQSLIRLRSGRTSQQKVFEIG